MTHPTITGPQYRSLTVLVDTFHSTGQPVRYSNVTTRRPSPGIYHLAADRLVHAGLAVHAGINTVTATPAGFDLVARRRSPIPGVNAVAAWSAGIHFVDDDLDRWCIDTARRIAHGDEPTPWPGGRKSTGVARIETITRILGEHREASDRQVAYAQRVATFTDAELVEQADAACQFAESLGPEARTGRDVLLVELNRRQILR